ncbi:sugar ABC transporter ATP-binding protein [Roseimicrobium sp. ORNL1]|uniref:sugar ABC transporter ATP-binding protein n=1 Tax=Roseimicrobium sp. ORNL1 TaxID=2711231 RepID=UPI0013E14B7E|nr:sugar ABC transporter ATP-binding protein [Roseimicrobium sp. ORNL1]QIF02962.1 sugar ABC transporter ATP-binding protein [Roseimicrobium sp. ORNL1]
MDTSPSLLEVSELTKRFPGVVALDGVSLSVAPGETVAVIGENGAGKSTLMKIVAGIYQPEAGAISWNGNAVTLRSVNDAQALGISLIHQELNLADNLDVAGNVFLGREPRRAGLLQRKVMRERTNVLLKRLRANFNADTPVEKLSLGQRQLVEIAKALSMDTKLLIMDEPTSSLSGGETEVLFEVMQGLQQAGMSILYISHRLGEVKRVADRVVALRDGKNAGELQRNEVNHDAMVRLMVGRDLSQVFEHRPQHPEWVVLDVVGLRTQAHPQHQIGIDLKKGEIVGMAGLVGAGRTEVLRALFGVEPPLAGKIMVNGKELNATHPRQAIEVGMALVPEDRKALGVFLPESVKWNVGLPAATYDARSGIFLNRSAEKRHAEKARDDLRVKSATLETLVGTLSGGNQQKVALGKWLAMRPMVLLLDEPTRGIDVGAKREIYTLMEQLAAEGMAILFASSEMEEILAMSDRVMVMHEGRQAGWLEREDLSEEAIMRLATGH